MLEFLQNGRRILTTPYRSLSCTMIPYSILGRLDVEVDLVYGLAARCIIEIWMMGKFVHRRETAIAMVDVALNRTPRERTRDTRKSHCD